MGQRTAWRNADKNEFNGKNVGMSRRTTWRNADKNEFNGKNGDESAHRLA